MPEDFDPEDFEGVVAKKVTLDRPTVRRLEKASKERDAAIAERDELLRERAFLKAGIPDTPLGQYFIRGYDGPTDDVDALRAKAIEVGLIQGTAEQQQQREHSLAGHAAALGAQTGAAIPGAQDVEARMRAAKSAGEVAQLMQEHLANNGMSTQELLSAQHQMGGR